MLRDVSVAEGESLRIRSASAAAALLPRAPFRDSPRSTASVKNSGNFLTSSREIGYNYLEGKE